MNTNSYQLPQNSSQLVVVTAPHDQSITGRLWKFERIGEQWTPVGESHPITLGRTGLAWGFGLHDDSLATNEYRKREGDGKSPAGIFTFGTGFGYTPSENIRLHIPYEHVSAVTQCIEDVNSTYYNRILDRTSVIPDWNEGDFMCRTDDLYKWGVFVNHNTPATNGRGSCIFFHLWRAPDKPTAGCTGMEERNMLLFLKWLNAAQNPCLVQMTSADYAIFKQKYPELPELD